MMGADPTAAKRAFDALMTMKKIDIAAIEAARRALEYRVVRPARPTRCVDELEVE